MLPIHKIETSVSLHVKCDTWINDAYASPAVKIWMNVWSMVHIIDDRRWERADVGCKRKWLVCKLWTWDQDYKLSLPLKTDRDVKTWSPSLPKGPTPSSPKTDRTPSHTTPWTDGRKWQPLVDLVLAVAAAVSTPSTQSSFSSFCFTSFTPKISPLVWHPPKTWTLPLSAPSLQISLRLTKLIWTSRMPWAQQVGRRWAKNCQLRIANECERAVQVSG